MTTSRLAGAQVPASTTPAITIVAYGVPAPQGSMKVVRSRTGKAVPVCDNAATMPWRDSIGWAARRACTIAGISSPLDEPLRVRATFTMPKPLRAPKRRRSFPATKPDVDKLQRAAFDALTHIVWVDDSRIVHVSAEKVFPGEPGVHGEALLSPGVQITVWRIAEAEAVAA